MVCQLRRPGCIVLSDSSSYGEGTVMICMKRKYDKIGAMIALSSTEFHGNKSKRRHECRMYWCVRCKAYHLTSQKGR